MRRTFVSQTEKITTVQTELTVAELCLYCGPNVITLFEWQGISHAKRTTHVRDTINVHKISVEKLESKKRVARLGYKFYDNIKMGNNNN
jgi:hypothetical protein